MPDKPHPLPSICQQGRTDPFDPFDVAGLLVFFGGALTGAAGSPSGALLILTSAVLLVGAAIVEAMNDTKS